MSTATAKKFSLTDLDPKKLDKKLKSLELTEARVRKEADRLVGAKSLNKILKEVEVLEAQKAALIKENGDLETANTEFLEQEKALWHKERAAISKEKLALTEAQKAFKAKENDVNKLKLELSALKGKAEREQATAKQIRTELELKLARFKRIIKGVVDGDW